MANTIANDVYRKELYSKTLQERLLKTLVANGISRKFTWGVKEIDNPYGSAVTANSGSIDGTYTVADYTTTDDTLTVDTQIDASNHIYKFEKSLTNFDMFMERMEEISDAVSEKIDETVLAAYVTGAGTTSITASGGLTTSNVDDVFAAVRALGAGYKNIGKHYIVISSTEVPVLIQWAAGQGFNFADSALKNGEVAEIFGVRVYVSNQLPADTLLAGVSGTNSYVIADDFDIMEKEVTGKTGKEIAIVANIGAKVWKQKENLTANISLA